MSFTFYKYQGTGNDFIIVDNRLQHFPKDDHQGIARICDRRFGVGADGLILLEDHPNLDFRMVYYNSDGHLSSMCGNGGRCLVSFARHMGLIRDEASFEAIDGVHMASVEERIVRLKMNDVSQLREEYGGVFLDTGSPHLVLLKDEVEQVDVQSEGRQLRNECYGTEGANINFVQPQSANEFRVRTYERGVEGETLSCGTGVTAVALAMHHQGKTEEAETVSIVTPGGDLAVQFQFDNGIYRDIWLIGPAQFVFKGDWHA
ncbi:diaminopimelate epimerase [Aureitalea marina]|uniref:Diaminopimelate epimerase n=1 Tax=Aureitalea marina TaxID=930804 RepID=A0A2S7KN00_9FLAO|nr:diaminopimelate epimerase [Aureitalea marina]PQB04007.1 diaminopimelate epimerase [Aureitalea marina]